MRTSLLVLALLLVPSAAFADVLPADICTDEGAPCTIPGGGVGVCQPATCSRLSYGAVGPNGEEMNTPVSVSYPCNRCQPAFGSSANTPMILGLAVCCVLFIGALTFGGLFLFLRKKKKKKPSEG